MEQGFVASPLLKGLNTEQQAAVLNEHKRLLVLAGAGAGKTKTLIQRILHLIFEKNVKPSSILAITFTRNAANEMAATPVKVKKAGKKKKGDKVEEAGMFPADENGSES